MTAAERRDALLAALAEQPRTTRELCAVGQCDRQTVRHQLVGLRASGRVAVLMVATKSARTGLAVWYLPGDEQRAEDVAATAEGEAGDVWR